MPLIGRRLRARGPAGLGLRRIRAEAAAALIQRGATGFHDRAFRTS